MRHDEIIDYINILKQYSLSVRVDDINRYVFERIFDKNYGKRFIKKDEFIKEFNTWLKNEFINNDRKFYLESSIPDNSLLDVKLVNIPWVHPVTKLINTHYIWLIQIHNGWPIISSDNNHKVKVNALCTTGLSLEYIPDEDCNIHEFSHVGVVIFSDIDSYGNNRFIHVIKHELVHYGIICLLTDLNKEYYFELKESDDEFKFYDINEFLADFIPYYHLDDNLSTTEKETFALNNFNKDLFVKVNPKYSYLYKRIIEFLLQTPL